MQSRRTGRGPWHCPGGSPPLLALVGLALALVVTAPPARGSAARSGRSAPWQGTHPQRSAEGAQQAQQWQRSEPHQLLARRLASAPCQRVARAPPADPAAVNCPAGALSLPLVPPHAAQQIGESAAAEPCAHSRTEPLLARAAEAALGAASSRKLQNVLDGALSMDITPAAADIAAAAPSAAAAAPAAEAAPPPPAPSPGAGSTAAATAAAAAAAPPSKNPWYDQHVLGTGGGVGSGNVAAGAIVYGRLNTSSAAANLSMLGLGDQGGGDGGGGSAAAADPPLYEYPPVGRHPTVFFTLQLRGFSSPGGLGPEEQAALSAAVNAFLAPAPDAAVSNTTVITQAVSDSGLWLPCATVLLSGDVTLQDFLAATLQGDPNLVFPTATWGQVRTVNVKEALPSTPAAVTFSWSAGDYGNCSALCGGGQQARRVTCTDSLGNEAEPAACPVPAPPSTRECQTQPCQASLPTNFSLALGAWGSCNSSCGVGSRTRGATCISREGYVGSLTSCYTSPQELVQQLWEPCRLPPCPTYYWSYSDWICNNTAGCGGGVASRTATCMHAEAGKRAPRELCAAAELDNSTQPCAQNPCAVYYWRTRELSDCEPDEAAKPCGRYVQRRRYDCVNMTSGEVVPHIWCSGPKPDLGDVECPSPANCTAAITPPLVHVAPNGDAVGAEQPAPPQPPAPPTPPAPLAPGGGSSDSAGGGTNGTAADTSTKPLVPEDANATAADPAAAGALQGAGDQPPPLPPPPALPVPPPPPAPKPASSWQTESNATSSAAEAPESGGMPGLPLKPLTLPAPTGSAAGKTGNASEGGQQQFWQPPLASVNETLYQQPTGNFSAATASPMPTASMPGNGTGAGAGTGGGSGSDDDSGLGPGNAVPEWLLANPTHVLQSLLECPYGSALSSDGVCCKGPNLDIKGTCCDGGVVDPCGSCNGTGRAIDSLGACCYGTLDAQGVCCPSTIDECGVCNGTNACDLRAELSATLPWAALFLIPNSNANRRLRSALQDAVAGAIAAASGRPFDRMRLSIVLSSPGAAGAAPAAGGSSAAAGGGQQAVDGVLTASQFEGDDSYSAPQQHGAGAGTAPDGQEPWSGDAAAQDATGGRSEGEGEADGGPDGQVVAAALPSASASAGFGGGNYVNSRASFSHPGAAGSSGSTGGPAAGDPASATGLLHASEGPQPVQLDTLPADQQPQQPSGGAQQVLLVAQADAGSGQLGVAGVSSFTAAPLKELAPAQQQQQQQQQQTSRKASAPLAAAAAAAAAAPAHRAGNATSGAVLPAQRPGNATSRDLALGGGGVRASGSTLPAKAAAKAAPKAASANGTWQGAAAQAPAATNSSNSSNSILFAVVVHSGNQQPGPDTGLVLLALNRLPGNPIAVPGSRSNLTVNEITSVVRTGTCGDGVCQVNERLSWGNSDSCQADCALPFLSCPPFDPSLPPCNGRGVCYNSVGSCSCARGYTGADCSVCALNYKQVNGFCVAAKAIAPPRSCSGPACGSNVTASSSLLVQPLSPGRSFAGAQAALTSVVLGALLAVAAASYVVRRMRAARMLRDYREELEKAIERYKA